MTSLPQELVTSEMYLMKWMARACETTHTACRHITSENIKKLLLGLVLFKVIKQLKCKLIFNSLLMK